MALFVGLFCGAAYKKCIKIRNSILIPDAEIFFLLFVT